MQAEVIILPAFFLMVAFVVWTAVTAWQRRQRLRLLMEFNNRFIDRLDSVKDFIELAKVDGAPLDTGEDVQIVCGVVATIALLGWVARAVPEIWTVPSFALVTVVSSVVVAAAAALTVWDMKRTSQG